MEVLWRDLVLYRALVEISHRSLAGRSRDIRRSCKEILHRHLATRSLIENSCRDLVESSCNRDVS